MSILQLVHSVTDSVCTRAPAATNAQADLSEQLQQEGACMHNGSLCVQLPPSQDFSVVSSQDSRVLVLDRTNADQLPEEYWLESTPDAPTWRPSETADGTGALVFTRVDQRLPIALVHGRHETRPAFVEFPKSMKLSRATVDQVAEVLAILDQFLAAPGRRPLVLSNPLLCT